MAAEPEWQNIAAWIGAGGGAALMALWKGRSAKPEGPEATLSGALVDARSIKALTVAVEDASALYHKDAGRIIEATEDYARAIRDNTEAIRANTDASINIAAFSRGSGK